ncbi:putative gp41-like protein [Esparto virus]|uniref:Putative gp41-like protein n=1 Tax=Esparto virus TaxID=2072209 RepID=A0A2I7G318_9VIRU|nr:putative gp41-like protein [Esparto virus]AUQ44017.1 putative gp41-like protein [Esparto virus]
MNIALQPSLMANIVIKFANTNGQVYDYDQTIVESNSLGTMTINENLILIYDRYPEQQTTQLNVNSLISTLHYILHKLDIQTVDLYLPKMSANMNEEAEIQYQFRQMSIIQKNVLVSTKKTSVCPTVFKKSTRSTLDIKIYYV